jgi:hypothetical protein
MPLSEWDIVQRPRKDTRQPLFTVSHVQCQGAMAYISLCRITERISTVDCKNILHPHSFGPFKKLQQSKTIGIIAFWKS